MLNKIKSFFKRFKILVAFVEFIRVCILECYKLKWILTRSKKIKFYFKTHEIKKLQIGAGLNYLNGWLNVDYLPSSDKIIFLDVTEKFPFKDNTFDYILAEHMIQELTYDQACFMLKECYRILKPGGKIRVSIDDLEILVGIYKKEKDDIQKYYIKWITDVFLKVRGIDIYSECFVVNCFFYNFKSKFNYDRITLQNTLEKAGFINITKYEPGKSDDENLQGVESHGKVVNNEILTNFITTVLEGTKHNSEN